MIGTAPLRRLLLLSGLALLPVAGVAGVAGAATHKKKKVPKTKIVHVVDDFYTCSACTGSGTENAKLKVKLGGSVKWTWAAGNQNTHDVRFKAPKKHKKGVKSFHSDLAATDFSYKRKFTITGTYRIYCSLHEGMRLRLTVTK